MTAATRFGEMRGQRHELLLDWLAQDAGAPGRSVEDRLDLPIGRRSDPERPKTAKMPRRRRRAGRRAPPPSHPTVAPWRRALTDAARSGKPASTRIEGRHAGMTEAAQQFDKRLAAVAEGDGADARPASMPGSVARRDAPTVAFPRRHALCEPRRWQAAASVPDDRDGASVRHR